MMSPRKKTAMFPNGLSPSPVLMFALISRNLRSSLYRLSAPTCMSISDSQLRQVFCKHLKLNKPKKFWLQQFRVTYVALWHLGECIPDICHGHCGRCPCKFLLSGVNFYRMNTKNCIQRYVVCNLTHIA